MSPLILFASYAVIVFVAMYIFVYIPNKKKQRKMQELHQSIAPGNRVITIGGVVGTVVKRDDSYVTILIDEEKGATMQVVLYAVGQIIENSDAPESAGAIEEKR